MGWMGVLAKRGLGLCGERVIKGGHGLVLDWWDILGWIL